LWRCHRIVDHPKYILKFNQKNTDTLYIKVSVFPKIL
jgi:hypothetical protein